MSAQHTPGPWRWEINRELKILHLVGGRPQYDLTIMDFERWGMTRAVVALRDTAEDGMNIMHRLPDRPDWIAPFPGRDHHKAWCSDVTHPDMRLIAAAPDLLNALRDARQFIALDRLSLADCSVRPDGTFAADDAAALADYDSMLEQISTAITKASGEEA